MNKQEEIVVDNMARVGYQSMHGLDSPKMDSIELALWRTIAADMLRELRRTWEEVKHKGLD